ncbi:MAG: hypothetical protein ACFFCO_11245, partial [Promethearchaeota archaeon]
VNLHYPLWLDTSTWEDGATTAIPTSDRTFRLSQETRLVLAGAYSCWMVRWDGSDFLTTQYEELSYAQQSSVLIRYHQFVDNWGSDNEWSATKELTASNLDQFGFYPDGNLLTPVGMFATVGVIALFMLLLGIAYLRSRRDDSQPTEVPPTPRSAPSTPEPVEPLPWEAQPEESVYPIEKQLRDTSDPPPPLEKGALSPCIVCRLPIKPGSAVLGCPHCGGFAHKRHLLEWIKVKGACPYCHKKLKESQLTHVDLSS